MKLLKPFIDLGLLLVAILAVGFATHWYLNLPIVYSDYITKDCVKVLSPEKEHSCNNMPKQYVTTWVAPR